MNFKLCVRARPGADACNPRGANKMKIGKIFLLPCVAAASLAASAAASKGSCDSKAVALKASQTVTLVDEWDSEYKENTGYGIYVLSVTIKKGGAYSIWTDPDDAVTLDVDYDWEKYDAYVSFETDSLDDGTQYARLASTDWDEDDPASVKFYVYVSGDIGRTVRLYSQASYRSFVPQGSEDNPLSITFGSSEKAQSVAVLDDGSYHMVATLSKDVVYTLRTTGGTADSPAGISVGAGIEDVLDDPAYADDPGNDAVIFTPPANGRYGFSVDAGGPCVLHYRASRAVAADISAVGLVPDGLLGTVSVTTRGAAAATWTIDGDSTKNLPGGYIVAAGDHTLKFPATSVYKASAASTNVTVAAGDTPLAVEVYYYDTFDPKDDTAKGATAVSLKNVDTDFPGRTLWENDPEDNFAIAGVDGYYFDFTLKDVDCDAVFSITNAELGAIVENVQSATLLSLPKTKSKYILSVKHGTEDNAGGGYTLSGKYANVGAIKFAKNALAVKENAPSAVLTVKRTAKDGRVRVRYGTVAGTALPGVDYIAQSGVLEWEHGDSKDKTIAVKLLPDLVPYYEGNKTFSVRLEALDDDERDEGEYPAAFSAGGDLCTVTLTETSKPADTVESAYAKKAPKLATVKTETVALESGTYYGVLAEDGFALTNGLPALASVTFTASAAAVDKAKLSAKVSVAGKTYTFSATGWDESEEPGKLCKRIPLQQKLNRIDEETGRSVSATVTNWLYVAVAKGAAADSGDWLKSGAEVELLMNVPDANNKGFQEDILYRGSLYRNNAKIQEYLVAVTNFTGYYTVALVPEGVTPGDGIPAGNGYVTLNIDNKGTVKVAGMLADGTTKPSMSAVACGIAEDPSSANGYAMFVPVFFAKSPVCFGGILRLYADESGTVVVDSTATLVWNNDNAKLTYWGDEGYSIDLSPAGGFYDTIINLQAWYLNRDFQIETADMMDFPAELAAAGYALSADVTPAGGAVSLAGDVFSTDKKSLVKDGKLYDLAASVNPCNIQVKVVRATGLVSGSFSLWSENEDGSSQKEITGVKHNGVLILSRDAFAPLEDSVVAAGFCTKSLKVTDVNEDTGKTSTRNWSFSLPFNLLGIELDEPDWWADDWGEAPIE